MVPGKPGAISCALPDDILNREQPFGSPDGQGPVLVLSLIVLLIRMPPFRAPGGRGPEKAIFT